MITLVMAGPSCFGSITSWKEIPETGMSFSVSSPLGPLPFRVEGAGGLTTGAGAAGTAGVALLLLLPVPVVSPDSSPDEEDDVRSSGECDRLEWFGSCGAAFDSLRLEPEVPLGVGRAAVAAGASPTLTDFLAAVSLLDVFAVDDPLSWCCDDQGQRTERKRERGHSLRLGRSLLLTRDEFHT